MTKKELEKKLNYVTIFCTRLEKLANQTLDQANKIDDNLLTHFI